MNPSPMSRQEPSIIAVTFLLALLTAIGPFAIDTYLPAFGTMARALPATELQIQQTLAAYMVPFAVMALWHGPLADCFGRRVVIISGMALFAVASTICMLAPTIEWLWFGRALQGMVAGAGMIVGRAVVRDLFDGVQAIRLMSRMMMIFGLAPALAPIVGGVLLEWFGWRAIFAFLMLFSASLCWACWRYLPETLPDVDRQPFRMASLIRNYYRMVANPRFLLLALAIACTFNGFFVYVLSAPRFVTVHLGLGATQFAWLFVPVVTGSILGSYLTSRITGRFTLLQIVAAGYAIMIISACANIAHEAFIGTVLPGSVVFVGSYCFGLSMVMPGLSLLTLDLFPHSRGQAASCQSLFQIGINALTAGLMIPLVWGSALSLAATAACYMALGLLAFVWWHRLSLYQQNDRS